MRTLGVRPSISGFHATWPGATTSPRRSPDLLSLHSRRPTRAQAASESAASRAQAATRACCPLSARQGRAPNFFCQYRSRDAGSLCCAANASALLSLSPSESTCLPPLLGTNASSCSSPPSATINFFGRAIQTAVVGRLRCNGANRGIRTDRGRRLVGVASAGRYYCAIVLGCLGLGELGFYGGVFEEVGVFAGEEVVGVGEHEVAEVGFGEGSAFY